MKEKAKSKKMPKREREDRRRVYFLWRSIFKRHMEIYLDFIRVYLFAYH